MAKKEESNGFEKPKDTRHLTNRKTWLQCAAKLEKCLDDFPVEVANMALEFVVRARKPDFIPSDQT